MEFHRLKPVPRESAFAAYFNLAAAFALRALAASAARTAGEITAGSAGETRALRSSAAVAS